MSLPILAILLMVNLLSSEPQSASKNDFHIVFYNVENLFDVKNDPETKDDDFTPDGRITGPIIGWMQSFNIFIKR